MHISWQRFWFFFLRAVPVHFSKTMGRAELSSPHRRGPVGVVVVVSVVIVVVAWSA